MEVGWSCWKQLKDFYCSLEKDATASLKLVYTQQDYEKETESHPNLKPLEISKDDTETEIPTPKPPSDETLPPVPGLKTNPQFQPNKADVSKKTEGAKRE